MRSSRKTQIKILPKRVIPAVLLVALGLLVGACQNTVGTNKAVSNLPTGTTSTTTTTSIVSYDSYVLNNVVVTAHTSTTPATYEAELYLNPASSAALLKSDCIPASTSSGSSNCTCQFTWNETNATSGTTVTIPRQVITNVDSVQKYALTCPAPSVYGTEILNGTQLSVTVLSAAGTTTQASFNTFTYTVGNTATITTSNFTDTLGTPFANIARYTCYEQQQRGMNIQSMLSTMTDANTLGLGTRSYPISNKFCLRKFDGTIPGHGANCLSLPAADYTAQSYYYNLYIQENAEGNINSGNSVFVCPLVKEALNQASGSLGTQGKFWPLDTTFALSLQMSSSYSVGVAANMFTASASDPVSQAVSCAQMAAGTTSSTSTTSGTDSANSLVSSCLGFAAPANSNGTCPVINGLQTHRLRRYYAVYPPLFDTTGGALNSPQSIDTIYVMDRPVTDPHNTSAVINMLGPKPCPFAFFDKNAVATGATGYYATSAAGWSGKNVDGIQFPHTDSVGITTGASASCSATLPLVNAAKTEITATTINAHNPVVVSSGSGQPTHSLQQVYVRPIQAWAPHYVEDTSFLACAPLSNPMQDPPLHFAKLTSNDQSLTYCAEVYPTQNDNVGQLDPGNLGTIAPYTSHVPAASTYGCNNVNHGNLTIPTGYPGSTGAGNYGLAYHETGTGPSTCDRTVLNPTDGIAWGRFPLLAPAADVESTLQTDPSFGCTIQSYNGSAASEVSPSGGCCGTSVSVIPGAAGNATGHLEPSLSPSSTNCQVPQY